MAHNVTFVTSYLKIYTSEYDDNKTFEKRLALFTRIVQLGIKICVFTSVEYETLFREMEANHENLRVMEILDKDDLLFSQMSKEISPQLWLPEERSHIKDTTDYMLLMHEKIEFIRKAIESNPFYHNIFCWFDFSLPYVFKDLENSLLHMQYLSLKQYTRSFLAMPGCWNHAFSDNSYLRNHICWRFCGGFFIGDRESMLSFHKASVVHFPEFVRSMQYNIVWEVNYWLWLEYYNHISPIWYSADHNDSIIHIPNQVFLTCILDEACQVVSYLYPSIELPDGDHLSPSSACYLFDNIECKHILVTRYVNYFYKDNWDCLFFNPTRQIRTVNVSSELNASFEAINFDIITYDETGLTPNPNAFSQGLEDIRLYKSFDNKIMFIASNVHYIPSQLTRMIIGEYDYEENICKNMRIVAMTWESRCEKNWSFLTSSLSKTYFIYKFSPYTVGYVEENADTLVFRTCVEHTFQNTLLQRFRGSTSFLSYDEQHWIGLVHYSEPTVPPTYHHCLLLIDKETMLPVQFSNPFKFGHQPIEFCIGFTIQCGRYAFWISQMDRDPKLLFIELDKLPLCNKCY